MKFFLVVTLLTFGCQNFIYSQSKEINFEKSYVEESKKNYEKAIEYIRDVNNGDCYECNFRLGWLYYLKGDNKNSISYYQSALEQKKGSIEAYYGLTYPYTALKQWKELEAVYKKILTIAPTQINALYYLGLVYYYDKNYNEAKKYCQKILDIYPMNYYSNLFMGDILTELGDTKKALEYYNNAGIYNMDEVELDKKKYINCYHCNLRLAYINFGNKNFESSLKFYDVANQLNPKSIEPYYGKTYSYYEFHDIDKLIPLYEKIIDLDPSNTYALYSIAYYQFQKKQYDLAKNNCEKVLSLFPFDYYSNNLMGDIYKEMGDHDAAANYYSISLIYNPNEKITKTKLQNLSKLKK